MTLQLDALWAVSAISFFIAALLSLRYHFLAGRRSNLWLWFAASMSLIGTSRAVNLLVTRNPLWEEVVTALLLVGAVILAVTLADFSKEVNLCMNCGSSTSDLPANERKRKAERMLRGF